MKLFPFPKFRAFDDDGNPLSGGFLYSYEAGTSTPKATYEDYAGTVNANPVELDGSGQANVRLGTGAYKLVLTDVNAVVLWTADNVASDDPGSFTTLSASGASTLAAVSASGQITSTVALGTAPLVITSTTKVANLNADLLDGGDWAAPGAIGSTTPAAGSFTTLAASGAAAITGNATVGGTLDVTGAMTSHVSRTLVGAHGESWIQGQNTEEITLSTAGATTDSVANLLPANSILEAVASRVTEGITTATDWKLGDATQAARFTGAIATLVAGTTAIGLNHVDPTVASANLGPVQSAAAKLRVTTTGTPGAGKIRVTVYYRQFVAPTS